MDGSETVRGGTGDMDMDMNLCGMDESDIFGLGEGGISNPTYSNYLHRYPNW